MSRTLHQSVFKQLLKERTTKAKKIDPAKLAAATASLTPLERCDLLCARAMFPGVFGYNVAKETIKFVGTTNSPYFNKCAAFILHQHVPTSVSGGPDQDSSGSNISTTGRKFPRDRQFDRMEEEIYLHERETSELAGALVGSPYAKMSLRFALDVMDILADDNSKRCLYHLPEFEQFIVYTVAKGCRHMGKDDYLRALLCVRSVLPNLMDDFVQVVSLPSAFMRIAEQFEFTELLLLLAWFPLRQGFLIAVAERIKQDGVDPSDVELLSIEHLSGILVALDPGSSASGDIASDDAHHHEQLHRGPYARYGHHDSSYSAAAGGGQPRSSFQEELEKDAEDARATEECDSYARQQRAACEPLLDLIEERLLRTNVDPNMASSKLIDIFFGFVGTGRMRGAKHVLDVLTTSLRVAALGGREWERLAGSAFRFAELENVFKEGGTTGHEDLFRTLAFQPLFRNVIERGVELLLFGSTTSQGEKRGGRNPDKEVEEEEGAKLGSLDAAHNQDGIDDIDSGSVYTAPIRSIVIMVKLSKRIGHALNVPTLRAMTQLCAQQLMVASHAELQDGLLFLKLVAPHTRLPPASSSSSSSSSSRSGGEESRDGDVGLDPVQKQAIMELSKDVARLGVLTAKQLTAFLPEAMSNGNWGLVQRYMATYQEGCAALAIAATQQAHAAGIGIGLRDTNLEDLVQSDVILRMTHRGVEGSYVFASTSEALRSLLAGLVFCERCVRPEIDVIDHLVREVLNLRVNLSVKATCEILRILLSVDYQKNVSVVMSLVQALEGRLQHEATSLLQLFVVAETMHKYGLLLEAQLLQDAIVGRSAELLSQ